MDTLLAFFPFRRLGATALDFAARVRDRTAKLLSWRPMTAQERYLADATDLADLERRLGHLDRHGEHGLWP